MDCLAGIAEPVSLPVSLAKVTEALLPLAGERRIAVHSRLAGDATVSGNASLLEKAIHNILSNAIRHSPEGAEVFIILTSSVLTVTNTGASIPEEDLPVLLPGRKIPEQVHRRQRPGAVSGQDDSGAPWLPISAGKYGNRRMLFGRVRINFAEWRSCDPARRACITGCPGGII